MPTLDEPIRRELIAQWPVTRRSAARLLVVERDGGMARHRHRRVAELSAELRAGDVLVANDARVFRARLRGRKPGGGQIEVLLLRPRGEGPRAPWEVLARGRQAPRPGDPVRFGEDGTACWGERLRPGRWLVYPVDEPLGMLAERCGEVPLPPYIRRPQGPTAEDAERYQTVYARAPVAVAAPTAGLHLEHSLLQALIRQGVQWVTLTLAVGAGTFLPPQVGPGDEPLVEPEEIDIPAPTAEVVNRAKREGRRVIAVGTTTVRALESAVGPCGTVRAGSGLATLTILPGYRFRTIDGLLTNFHLPGTSLRLLVGALLGVEGFHAAYREAVEEGYRFYSYGDAMLVL